MLNILLWPFCKSFDEPKLKCQFLSDNINECDRNLIRLHDHLQDGTMGVPGSGQQVLHLHFISILWFCNSTKVYHHIHDRRKQKASHYTAVSSFHEIPIHFRSYLCTDAGSKPMHTELHRSDGEYFIASKVFWILLKLFSSEHPGDGGVKLTDAVLSAKKVQLDAFR